MHLGIFLVFPGNRSLDCDFILVEQQRQNKPTLTLYTKRSTPILLFSSNENEALELLYIQCIVIINSSHAQLQRNSFLTSCSKIWTGPIQTVNNEIICLLTRVYGEKTPATLRCYPIKRSTDARKRCINLIRPKYSMIVAENRGFSSRNYLGLFLADLGLFCHFLPGLALSRSVPSLLWPLGQREQAWVRGCPPPGDHFLTPTTESPFYDWAHRQPSNNVVVAIQGKNLIFDIFQFQVISPLIKTVGFPLHTCTVYNEHCCPQPLKEQLNFLSVLYCLCSRKCCYYVKC